MKNRFTLFTMAGLFLVLVSASTTADEESHANLVSCLNAALEMKGGTIDEIEYEPAIGGHSTTWEIDIVDEEGVEWELECDAELGSVYKVELDIDDPGEAPFTDYTKVSESTAKETALQAFPGKVKETEYEMLEQHRAVYEFEIKTDAGEYVEVEIDARTGRIADVEIEQEDEEDEDDDDDDD